METVLHYYRYDVGKPQECEQYGALAGRLEGMGLKCFDSISMEHSNWYKHHVKPLDGQAVTLETKHLFDNQWNTAPTATSETGLRVFDWAEAIYPNRKIKEGQWLEQTDEMTDARRRRHVCGYCGAGYDDPGPVIFCTKCLGSEYLKETELHLLRLRPVCEGLAARVAGVPTHLKNEYASRQKTARMQRLKDDRARALANHKKKLEAAQTECDGFAWLIDHGHPFENCIYYAHTDKFCFGWRTPLTKEEKSTLLDVLCEFQWDYEFKTA